MQWSLLIAPNVSRFTISTYLGMKKHLYNFWPQNSKKKKKMQKKKPFCWHVVGMTPVTLVSTASA